MTLLEPGSRVAVVPAMTSSFLVRPPFGDPDGDWDGAIVDAVATG